MTAADFRAWQPEEHPGHLREHRPACRAVAAPGVVPRVRSAINHRIPDLGATCSPPSGGQVVTDPVLLVEVLSPSPTRR